MRAIILFLGVALAAPAVAADQFDLICTAKKTVVRYRLDLAAKTYCQGACTTTQQIQEITPGLIVLEHREKQFAGDKEFRDQVNRVTGEWLKYVDYGSTSTGSSLISGMCEIANFSGLPAAKF